jgi:hypothetical protein
MLAESARHEIPKRPPLLCGALLRRHEELVRQIEGRLHMLLQFTINMARRALALELTCEA